MIIKPHWESWLNSYEDFDTKGLKTLSDQASNVVQGIESLGSYLEEDDRHGQRDVNEAMKAADELLDGLIGHGEASKQIFENLEEEHIGLNVLSYTMLNLLDACAMEETEEQTFTEIIYWCRDQCRANWDAIYYDRIEGNRKEKRYLIVMLTNEDDRLFFKMRFG